MKTIEVKSTIDVGKSYDVIVAGAGVAGIAAAVQAKRHGKSVLLLEKMLTLGGLATAGLINLFVPMCNGRGTQIIKGMCDEFLKLSISMGYDSIPAVWKTVIIPWTITRRVMSAATRPTSARCCWRSWYTRKVWTFCWTAWLLSP